LTQPARGGALPSHRSPQQRAISAATDVPRERFLAQAGLRARIADIDAAGNAGDRAPDPNDEPT
jgi:hypothetical protein